MFVGSTATKALSNMAEVASRSSTGPNLSTTLRISKHGLSTSRKVDRGRRSLPRRYLQNVAITLLRDEPNVSNGPVIPRTVEFDRSWPMRLAADSDAGRIRHGQSRPREVSQRGEFSKPFICWSAGTLHPNRSAVGSRTRPWIRARISWVDRSPRGAEGLRSPRSIVRR